MKTQVIETIRKYDMISLGETVVLAISGGVDSMALMHLFAQIKNDFELTLIIAHLNHARRTQSVLDAKLVEQTAKQYGFAFEQDILPPQDKAGNFHAYAREYRYGFLGRVAKTYDATKVVTAHHAIDHLETVIERMMKTDIPAGLIGIQPMGIVADVAVIRPFIKIKKDDLYEYARVFSVVFHEDASNASDVYLRNRIRHQIVPLIIRERADVLEHVRNLSDNLRLDEAYFDSQIDDLMNGIRKFKHGYEMSFSWLQAIHASLRRRLIVRLVPAISKGAMLGLVDFLTNGVASGTFDVGCGIVVRKSYDKVLIVSSDYEECRLKYELELRVNTENVLPNGRKIIVKQGFCPKFAKNEAQEIYLCYNSMRMPLMVRSRRAGDRIQLINEQGRASVKKIMIDAKIPVDERESWPIVVDADDKLVWIPELKKSPMCLKKPNSSEDLWLKIYE